MKKAKILVSLIAQKIILNRFTTNFYIWQERYKHKMNSLFLAIKFKIRFKIRFYRKFGPLFHNRQVNIIRRHFSLYGQTFFKNRSEKS